MSIPVNQYRTPPFIENDPYNFFLLLARCYRMSHHSLKIGCTFGVFDIMHHGYFKLLEEARNNCDLLVVGLHVDPSIERPEKKTPIHSVEERSFNLCSLSDVDYVISYNTESELERLIVALEPDIRFIGNDYLDKEFTGKSLCPIHYVNRDHGWSATKVREKIISGGY